MKTKKDRYIVPCSVSVLEQKIHEASLVGTADGVKQGIAIALFALETSYGWKEKRLNDFMNNVKDIFDMPDIFGSSPTSVGVIERIIWN